MIAYLEQVDPAAAARARERYALLRPLRRRRQAYGYAASLGIGESCEDEVVAQLVELQRRAADYVRRDGLAAEDEYFYAEQNARLVANAEEYYRSMFARPASPPGTCATATWPTRSTRSLDHLGRHGDPPRRSSSGSTTRTSATRGRPRWARAASSTSASWRASATAATRSSSDSRPTRGTVTAASDWDAPAERKRVRPALPESYEALFHDVGSAASS